MGGLPYEDRVPMGALLIITRIEAGKPGSTVGVIWHGGDGSLRWEGDKEKALQTFGESMDTSPGGPRAVALDLLSVLIDYADGKFKPWERATKGTRDG